MLGKIIVDTQRVPLAVAEIFAHGAAGIGGDILHRRGIRSCGGHHDAIVHRTVVFEYFHHLRHRRPLLPDRDVDADHVAALLVNDRVQRDRRLAGLAVPDHQFALAPADWNHCIDRLDPGLQGFFNRLPVDHAGSEPLDRIVGFCLNGSFAIDGLAERIHHPSNQALAHGNRHDAACPLDLVALLDMGVFAQQHAADLIFFEIECDARDAALELDQFPRHHVFGTAKRPVKAAHCAGRPRRP